MGQSLCTIARSCRQTFHYDSAPGYLIFDRGTQFNEKVIDAVKSFSIHPKRTGFRSPWQNDVVERWVGNCRRDLLDHVIVVNKRHLKRLMSEYVRYYHEDRTHLALANSDNERFLLKLKTDCGRAVSAYRLPASRQWLRNDLWTPSAPFRYRKPHPR